MVVDRSINVSINNKNLTYYNKKGYDVKCGDSIEVKIEDLYDKSVVKINVKCDNCGNEKNMEYRLYNNNLKKYNLYYCNKCKHIKSKKTKLEKYGDENYNNIKKNKETCLKKYGVEHYNKLNSFKNKIKLTKLNKYGDENYNNIDKCKDTKLLFYGDKNYNNKNKIKETCLEKYGESNIFHISEIRKKILDSKKNRLIELYKDYNLIDVDYEKYNYICKCDKGHIFEIPKTIFYNRIKTNINICTICNPIGFLFSEKENDLLEFIKINYDDDIIQNSRDIIPPYELDIYLPKLKVAFEYNGLFWHSDKYKPKNYHVNKTNICEEKNIRLIHIYEDDWVSKNNIVKSRILNILGGSERIYARKCEIREISDNTITKKFLIDNHLQGFVGSKIKIGLFYKNELVSLMTFGNLRKAMGGKSKVGSYELLRFCNKLNTNVVGGASKLFKYFINEYNPIDITSYADRSWSIGNLYEKLGFNFIKKTSPNYHYIIDNKKIHRFGFRKDKLIKMGYDKNKTEFEIMMERGINKIYDSGNLKYQFINKKMVI